jgi:hypothetical protein
MLSESFVPEKTLLFCHIMFQINYLSLNLLDNMDYGSTFFMKRGKGQFIPLPWKVGEIVLRNMNKIDEFSTHFNHLNLKYAEKIKGFDPSNIFMDHMQSVGFSSAFTQTILCGEEEGNNQDTPL